MLRAKNIRKLGQNMGNGVIVMKGLEITFKCVSEGLLDAN